MRCSFVKPKRIKREGLHHTPVAQPLLSPATLLSGIPRSLYLGKKKKKKEGTINMQFLFLFLFYFCELPFYLGLYFWEGKLVHSPWEGVQKDLGDRRLTKWRPNINLWQNFGGVFSVLLFMALWGVINACTNTGWQWILANNQNWKLGWVIICALKRKEKKSHYIHLPLPMHPNCLEEVHY